MKTSVAVLFALIVTLALPAPTPPSDQANEWNRAVSLHKLGFAVTYVNGDNPNSAWVKFVNSPAGAILRLFGVRVVPWKETPVLADGSPDYANWESDRVKRSQFGTVVMPNQPAGTVNRGPSAIGPTGQVRFNCRDLAAREEYEFIPPFNSVAEIRAYINGLPEPK
jgi:hypothetical protein